MPTTILSHPVNHVYRQKAKLVNLGLFFLSQGDWQAVQAITHLIQSRRWVHV
jgi:hypothetical protein